jgi:hypothetical protein
LVRKKAKELGDRFITELEIAKVDLLKTIWLLLYGIKASDVW